MSSCTQYKKARPTMLWKGNRTKAAYTEQMYRLQHITFQQGMSLQKDLHQKLGNVKKYRPCFSFSTRKRWRYTTKGYSIQKITHKIRTGSNLAQQKKMFYPCLMENHFASRLFSQPVFGGGCWPRWRWAKETGHLWLIGRVVRSMRLAGRAAGWVPTEDSCQQ